MDVTVIGCGVSGLTTAIELSDAGHEVSVVTSAMPHDAVSVVAGAIWGPTTAEPRHRTGPWALTSRERFAEIALDESAGVAPMIHVDLRRDDEPHWGETTPWVTRLDPADVPAGYVSALRIDGFRIDPPVYLTWLLNQLDRRGGTVSVETVAEVTDVTGDAVVNCSGLGARTLVGDDTMYPIRGQMVLVDNDGASDGPKVVGGISDETDQDRIAYVYPRTNEVYLGGARDEGDERTEVDPDLTARILADTPALDPRVAGRRVVAQRVGLRPGRPEVRLERDTLSDGRVIVHNYGHGGAGYIMSWGCAAEVAELLDDTSG